MPRPRFPQAALLRCAIRGPLPVKQTGRRAKSAAVKRVVRSSLQEAPRCDARPRQNCSARQFSELSSAALSRPTPRHRRPSQHHQRGQPPASPRRGNVPMEGATPAGGGKPSAADSGQTRLAPNRRAQFWEYALPEGHRRRRPLGCCFAARVAPDLAGNPLETRDWSEAEIGQAKRSPYHTSTADEHTLKGDRPAEREDKQGTMEAHSMQRARRGGGGSPNLARWRNADARPNAPAPRGNAQFSRLWGLLSHSPLGAGVIRKLLLSGKSVSPLRAVDEEGCS